MKCAWQELLRILPGWLSAEVDRLGRNDLNELRLRLNQTPELILGKEKVFLTRPVCRDDLNFVVNTASRYSPWAATTVAQGYITAKGGHRIGLCGEAVVKNGNPEGMRNIGSLNIRVARDFPGIGKGAAEYKGSVLLLGPPGSGKTTLLRDLIRQRSGSETVAVVDERGELFPEGFQKGRSMDVLTGCQKTVGVDMLLKTMGPSCIAVDEITSEQDCDALIRAGWCGVQLLATAHAASVSDLTRRPVYRKLAQSRIFDHVLVLDRDKLWHEGRMEQ